jgi:hypothetical protein
MTIEVKDKKLYYPIKLYNGLCCRTDSELKKINSFFCTDKIILDKVYRVVLWIEGIESKQVDIVPIGKIKDISLQFGNSTKFNTNIEDVFEFEMGPENLYEKTEIISKWLENKKIC